MNNRENSLLIFAPIIKFKHVSSFITLCDLLLYAALAKSTKVRHIFIYTSIVSIRSFINQSRFTSSHVRSFHSIPISSIYPNSVPFDITRKRKDSKIRFLFLLLDFFTTARKKKHSVFHSTKNSTRYKKKRNRNDSRVGEDALEGVALRGWTTNKIKRARKREREGERDKKQKITK